MLYFYLNLVERQWLWAKPSIEGVSPAPRGGHSATLTGASLVIFGGHYYLGKEVGFTYLNDTHVLDVNSSRWIKPRISGTPPPPRYGHSAVLAGARIIIFGGKGKKSVFRDLHALDPLTMTWYQGPEGGGAPAARFDHTANLVGGTKMVIFGGWNGTDFYNDVYILDLQLMAWSKPECSGPAPCPRKGHCAILIGSNLVVHGGFWFNEEHMKKAGGAHQGTALQECYLNDIRVLDTETFVWSRLRVSGTPPEHRFGHTMDVSGSDIVMFGGYTKTSGARYKHDNNDDSCDYFMIWSTDTMSWKRGKYLGQPQNTRFGHTSTAIGPHLLIFGGWEQTKAQNDIIVLRECTNRQEGEEEMDMNGQDMGDVNLQNESVGQQ